MSRHTRFDGFETTSGYTHLYHDALLALWRERYEASLRTGAPAPNLPREVEDAVIQCSRRARSQFIAGLLAGGFRRVTRLLSRALRPGR